MVGSNQVKESTMLYKTFSSTLSSKNQVTIPLKIREAIGAEPGDQVLFVFSDNNEVVVKVNKKNSLLSLFGSMPPKGNNQPMEWSDIRKNAMEEMVSINNEEAESGVE
jgi:antitoxin PrlF